MEQATSLLQEHRARVPLSVCGQIYGTLAVMQARNGVPSNASLHYAAKHAFADQSHMFMDDPLFSLMIYEVEALQYQGKQDHALATLDQLVDSATLQGKRAMSGRDHMRVLVNMMQLSLKSKTKDLEYSAYLWKATMQKVQTFRSERRFDEVLHAYDVMDTLWGSDSRVQALHPLTVHW
jgi:hypothetical protein